MSYLSTYVAHQTNNQLQFWSFKNMKHLRSIDIKSIQALTSYQSPFHYINRSSKVLEINYYTPNLNKEHRCWFLQQNFQLHLQLYSKSFMPKPIITKMKRERKEKKIFLQFGPSDRCWMTHAWLGFRDGGSSIAIMFYHQKQQAFSSLYAHSSPSFPR
jgi:hypothetical protein